MVPSRSDFIPVRGLRYHVRRWGDPALPMVVVGHGWLDVSATFALAAQPLLERFQVLCPDWRGFGHTQWPQDGYWFQDYVADLEAIVDHYSPDAPLRLAGHSMGAQIASLYAGLRPNRVSKLVCADGLFLPDMPFELAAKRFRGWLDEVKDPPRQKTYRSFEELAGRVLKQHPQLSPERALFIARCWGNEDGNGVISLLADPKHRMRGPGLYRSAESMDIWKNVTAPTLFLDAGKSPFREALPADELARRRACFRDRREQVIAGAGHMLHFDAPEEFGRALAQFLGVITVRLLAALAVLLAGGAWADGISAEPVAQSAAPVQRAPGTKLLLLRLSLRMDRIDSEYNTMNRTKRAEQLDGAEGLLRQLRGRYLDPHQQNVLFKIEMRVRALRQELRGKP